MSAAVFSPEILPRHRAGTAQCNTGARPQLRLRTPSHARRRQPHQPRHAAAAGWRTNDLRSSRPRQDCLHPNVEGVDDRVWLQMLTTLALGTATSSVLYARLTDVVAEPATKPGSRTAPGSCDRDDEGNRWHAHTTDPFGPRPSNSFQPHTTPVPVGDRAALAPAAHQTSHSAVARHASQNVPFEEFPGFPQSPRCKQCRV